MRTLALGLMLMTAQLGAQALLNGAPQSGPGESAWVRADKGGAGGRAWINLGFMGGKWASAHIPLGTALKESGGVEFYARATEGWKNVYAGFSDAEGYACLLPLDQICKLGPQWAKVSVALSAFPKSASRFIHGRAESRPWDWAAARKFSFLRAASPGSWIALSVSDATFVASYIAPPKPKPEEFELFSDMVSDEGGNSYAYPAGKASIDSVEGGAAKSSRALKVTLEPSAWSGAAVGRTPDDLSEFKPQGVLEFWARGEKGGEAPVIALIDAKNRAVSRLPLKSLYPSGLSKGWARLRIPLSKFPSTATRWDEATQKSLSFDFAWDWVSEVSFDNDGPGNLKSAFWVDEIKLLKKPKG